MDINFPIVVTAAAISSIIGEVIHPHVYGLDLLPSFRIEIGDNKYLHVHHWLYGLGGLTLLYYYPTSKTWLNSMFLGGLLGILAQGLSYSTSHFVLYDREKFEIARVVEPE
jgi:hypothetical protein